MPNSIYDFSALDAGGRERVLGDYRGKAILVVNTASKCGLTPQLKGLEELNKKYRDQGLVIIGFPCDQFANQDPGTNEEIQAFCSINYGVTFPVLGKIEVNGDQAHPIFVWLKKKAHGLGGSAIKWNFTKFLIGKDGTSVKRFAPTTEPDKLIKDIEKVLAS